MPLSQLFARTAGERELPGEPSDEDGPVEAQGTDERNVHTVERVLSAIFGTSLLVAGLRDRSLTGVGKAIAGAALLYRGATGRSRVYRALGVNTATGRSRPNSIAGSDVVEFERSIVVDRPATELSEMLEDPAQLSRIVGGVATVTRVGEERHRWTVSGPFDRSTTWETRIVEDRPGELLRWESTDDSASFSEGSVRFEPAPGDRGTQVRLRIALEPPGGAPGVALAERLDALPETALGGALQRFKSLAETGEVPSLEENPSGRGSGDLA